MNSDFFRCKMKNGQKYLHTGNQNMNSNEMYEIMADL